MRVADSMSEPGPAATHVANSCHTTRISSESENIYLISASGIAASAHEVDGLTEFNHIHIRDGADWVCGRTLAFEDQELIRCETRDPDESEACRLCAEQILAHFGDPMHIQ